MNGGYDAVSRVAEKDGDAVGRPYSYRNARKMGNKSIVALQFVPGCVRPFYDSDVRTVHLSALNDRIRKDGFPPGGKSIYARAKRIMKEGHAYNEICCCSGAGAAGWSEGAGASVGAGEADEPSMTFSS